MTKRYEYFDADGNVKKPAAIACDGCGKDCEPESYFVGGEEDFCPTCYKKGNYTNGEHQKMGVKVVEESEPAKKKAKTSHWTKNLQVHMCSSTARTLQYWIQKNYI